MPSRRPSLPVAIAAVSLLAATSCAVFVAAGPIFTDDLWWHLAMGKVYAAQGPLVQGDPLLHTARPDAPIPHEWLFGVLVHGLDRVFGLDGLRVVHGFALVGILALAFLLLRRRGGTLGALVATLVFLLLCWWRLMQLRPDLFSIPAALLLYALVLDESQPPARARVGLAVLLLLIWANVHSLFAVAFPLLGAALLGLGVRAWGNGDSGPARARARQIVWTAGLGLAVTLLNPRGIQQHLTFFRSSSESAIWMIKDEWTPFHPLSVGLSGQGIDVLSWGIADVLLIAFALAIAVGLQRWRRAVRAQALRLLDPVPAALALAGIVALFVSIRFLWLLVFAILYLLGFARAWISERADWRPAARGLAAGVSALLALAFVVSPNFQLAAAGLPRELGAYLSNPFRADKYHAVAVAFLRETALEGNLFNPYGMGGFLAYWLSPNMLTFIDGRTEHYPEEVLQDFRSVVRRQGSPERERLEDVLDRRGVDVFFGVGVPNPSRLPGSEHTALHLTDAPGWLLVSRSLQHAIYLRNDPSNRENLERVSAWYRSRGIPFEPQRGLDVRGVLASRPDWAARYQLVPCDFAQLLRARRAPDANERFDALSRLSLVYALLGLHEEQLALDREAAALRPREPAPHRRRLYAHLRRGELREAGEAARALRSLCPGDPICIEAVRLARLAIRQGNGEEADRRRALLADRFPLFDASEGQELERHIDWGSWLTDAAAMPGDEVPVRCLRRPTER